MAHQAKRFFQNRTMSKASKFNIIVETEHNNISVSLNNQNDRISTLKREIEKQLKIRFRQQELFFIDSEKQKQRLLNEKTFLYYNIKSGNKLKCIIVCDYIIINAITKTKMCRITSDSKNILNKQVLYFKSLIQKKLIKKGQKKICLKDQYLLYQNQIMENDIILNEYLGNESTANIYLQTVICERCRQLTQQLDKEMEKEEKLEQKNSTLESNMIELDFANRIKYEQILSLQNEKQKQNQNMIFLARLNQIKDEISDKRMREKVEQIERYKKREMRATENENGKDIFTMNRFEDYASYFGDNYPMIASIISYYEAIMLMLSMIFAAMNSHNEENENQKNECSKSEQFIHWLAFVSFFMIPFIVAIYKIINSKHTKYKWYETLYEFFHLYAFRIIILFLLMLSCELKPFSCYIDNEIIFQLSIIVIGIVCLIIHTVINKLKQFDHEQENTTISACAQNSNEQISQSEQSCNGIEENELTLQTQSKNELEGENHDKILMSNTVSDATESVEMSIDIDDNISDCAVPYLSRQKQNETYTLIQC